MKRVILVLFTIALLMVSSPVPFAYSIPTPEEVAEMPDTSGIDPGSPEWVEKQEQIDSQTSVGESETSTNTGNSSTSGNNTSNVSGTPDPNSPDNTRPAEYYRIFTDDRWSVVMFWYNSMAILSGGFLVAIVVKSGYKYMLSAANPGLKASFMEDLQRCIVAMAVLALAPIFIKLLIGVNDGFVAFFANIVNHITTAPPGAQVANLGAAGMFEKVIAAPFELILKLIQKVFGLSSVDQLIFNGKVSILSGIGSIDTGNVFANVLLKISMCGFDVYFNALYTIRRWVVTAIFTATPIIVWLWAFTGERQVIEIWAAEIFQTVFVQSAHALALGVYITILNARNVTGAVDGVWLTQGMSNIAVWIAGLGGALCTLVIVIIGYKIITASSDKEAAEAKSSLGKALIGLSILGGAVIIAGYMSSMLSGKWF